MKTQTKIDYLEWGIKFIYKVENRQPAHCYIKRIGNLVIATETDDNEGMSITNAAEAVAWQVSQQFQIDPTKLIWIEHYIMNQAHDFDQVTFEIGKDFHNQPCFKNPAWKHLAYPQVNDLIEKTRRGL